MSSSGGDGKDVVAIVARMCRVRLKPRREAMEKMLIGVQRSSNLHRGSDNMGLRDLLRRRKRNKARSEEIGRAHV